jgi:hypothetical protein
MKNEKSKKNDPLPKNMHYLTIDSKNKLSEENDDILNQRITDLANSTIVENVGNEINKFFIKILPENKEADLLKFNYSLSSKIIKAFGLNNIMLKQKCEEYISDIINMKIEPNSPFSLTSEINEKLSLILSVIYRTIKKEGKLFSIDDINNWVIKEYEENKGILDILQKSSNNDLNATYSYMCSPNIYTDLNDGSDLGKSSLSPFMANKINLEPLRITQVVQSRKTTAFLNLNESKKMNSIQNKNANKIPLELFILREKFENIKTVKLPLKKHNAIYNELIPLEQNDIIFSIFVLSNLKLLFQRFFGIELDLSNEIILKDELADINNYYEKILKENKRSRKMTYYKSENKKRIYDVYKNKSYNQNNKSAEEIESSDNFSMFSIREINIDETKKNQERFINKHIYSLHMIIIYWYFITKLSELKYFSLINNNSLIRS